MSEGTPLPERFWEGRALEALDEREWEALCDGCGRCCLQKFEDDDTRELFHTCVACRLLDVNSARCSNYPDRFREVPDCLSIRPLTEDKLRWLPTSCAYRRLAEGKALPAWHPLLSGDPHSTHLRGAGIAGRCVSETVVPLHEWPLHLLGDSA